MPNLVPLLGVVLTVGVSVIIGKGPSAKHNWRTGGIDVTQHSKDNRGFKIHYHLPTKTPSRIGSSGSFFRRRNHDMEHDDDHEHSYEGEDAFSSDTLAPPPELKVGIVFPRQIFQQRRYQSVISRSLAEIDEERRLGARPATESRKLLKHIRTFYNFGWNATTFRLEDDSDSINFSDLVVSPPPSDITDILCQHMANGTAAILYFTDTEKFGRSTAASQYFLQMAGFLGIPVIAWNADNSGLETRSNARSDSGGLTGHLQLAPSVDHQVSAMLSILGRYNWPQFGIVTSEIAGHDDFVQAVRDQVATEASKFTVQAVFKVTESSGWDVSALAQSEVRIVLLYCTQSEASLIMEQAAMLELTSPNYLWLVTQSVIGDPMDRSFNRRYLPVGMLGIHFEVDLEKILQGFVSLAMKVFFHGIDTMIKKTEIKQRQNLFNYSLDCQDVNPNFGWQHGPNFYRHLLNLTFDLDDRNGSARVFNLDGSVSRTELKIMNLKPSDQPDAPVHWEEVGTWNTWDGLDIKDIVWPGGSHVPPQGVPEKFHVKITFLEEPPFIQISDPDPVTSKCSMNRGVPCSITEIDQNVTKKCCSGLCIDLLRKFEDELGFTYDLLRVVDPKWGTFENGTWNGLMETLVNKKTDMVLSALKINGEREMVVDFTVPYLETGIAIAVAKRTGIISPTAFFEPFDTSSWMLVALIAIQASAFSIFLFEWLSPSGYNMQTKPSKTDHKFSLFRTYWLVWAVLFQASVQVDCPRGTTARFMSSVWALFAVVFLALYTANLAAFMIPRKEFHDLSGLDDVRISNPWSEKPGLRFATVPYSYAQVTLKKYYPNTYRYMRQFDRYNSTSQAIKAVKDGELDAFIYDGTVLNYLVSQDEECRLLQVGSWSAMTGYGIAFPHHSKYKKMFNDKLLELRENGDLERLSRFWMSGMCKPDEKEKRASEPLSIAQFLSAFLLLGIGTVFSVLLLAMEHLYMKYLQNHVEKTNKSGCFSLVSLSIGKSCDRSASFKKENSEANCHMSMTTTEEEFIAPTEPNCNVPMLTKQNSIDLTTSVDLPPQYKPLLAFTCRSGICGSKLGKLYEELSDAHRQIQRLEEQLKKHGYDFSDEIGKEFHEKETVL